MPLAVLTAEEKKAASKAGASDLKWLLAENNVGIDIQEVLFHFGFTSIRMFMGLGDTRAEVKETMKDQFGVAVGDGLAQRQQVAAVQAAWDAASAFVAREATAKADARAGRYARPIAMTDQQAMQDAFEKEFGEMPWSMVPSKTYLGLKSEDVEDNEIRVEELAAVSSKDDAEDDLLHSGLDDQGRVVVRKGAKNGKPPKNSEELRSKMDLMSNCWLFLKTKHSNRPWLADLDDKVFTKYVNYLLGKEVWGLRNKKGVGPSWNMILNFDMVLRKDVSYSVSRGHTLKQAFTKATENIRLLNTHIVIPMTLAPDEAGPESNGLDAPFFNESGNGSRRGKGGKGGKGLKPQRTSDAPPPKGLNKLKVRIGKKPICFKFNNEGENCNGECGMAHVCQFCFSTEHPKYKCPNASGKRARR